MGKIVDVALPKPDVLWADLERTTIGKTYMRKAPKIGEIIESQVRYLHDGKKVYYRIVNYNGRGVEVEVLPVLPDEELPAGNTGEEAPTENETKKRKSPVRKSKKRRARQRQKAQPTTPESASVADKTEPKSPAGKDDPTIPKKKKT